MSDRKVCYIFGAGEHFEPSPVPGDGDVIIAADGGYDHILRSGLRADLIIGDLDSLGEIPRHADVRILPQEKDDTDMAAAIRCGWERGYRIFHIYGGTGGRLDHTLANIQCIADLAGRGARGFLYDRDTVITAIRNTAISFPHGCTGVVSVFSHSDTAAGVYETGLKYPLVNAALRNNCPLGVSNEFTGAPGSVEVRAGTLVVIYPKNIREIGM